MAYINYFENLYYIAPSSLKAIVDKTKDVKQSLKWHPEGDVYIHTELVTNRLYNTYYDVNLAISGFFHDLGKIEKTFWDEEGETWRAPLHELASYDIVNEYEEWIRNLGGDVELVSYLVKNHMKIKYIDTMSLSKKISFYKEGNYEYLYKFNSADYGGLGDYCNQCIDITEIDSLIHEYDKEKEEKRIIKEKFNGNLIMDKYPDLKDRKLGDAINGFKKYIGESFNTYILNNSSGDIMSSFDNYLKA